MRRQTNRLSPAFVRAVQHSGRTKGAERHTDGHGLMLSVEPSGSKAWVQRIVIHGRQRTFGLGGYPLVGLANARREAFDNRALARQGGDPLALRARRDIPDFAAATATVIDIQAGGWKNAGKSRGQWEQSLARYAFPAFGAMRVDQITTADVLAAVLPIWAAKRETASRVRQRISAVMKWAIAQGYRQDDPAGAAVLAALPKGVGKAKRHHRALPYSEVADAVRRVRESQAWAGTKLLFEFLVLTAARSGEARLATWDEVDLAAATWTIPADRMKAKAEHRVPLAGRCIDLLEEAKDLPNLIAPVATGGLLFPSVRGRPTSDSTVSKLLRQLGIDAVPHGFRSTFRDWAAERTNTPHAVMEAALAHTIPNAAERAYARSDLFDRRRALMERWAAHVCGGGEVVAIGAGRREAGAA